MVLCLLAGIAAIIAAVAYRKDKKRGRCQCGGNKVSVSNVTSFPPDPVVLNSNTDFYPQPYPGPPDNYQYRDLPDEKYRPHTIPPPLYEQGYDRGVLGDNRLQYREIPIKEDEKSWGKMNYGQ